MYRQYQRRHERTRCQGDGHTRQSEVEDPPRAVATFVDGVEAESQRRFLFSPLIKYRYIINNNRQI